MQDEFDDAENEAAGDGPDHDGMQQAVRRHADGPDGDRARGVAALGQQMAVLAGGKELALERVIHQRVTREQEKNDLHRFEGGLRGKWQQTRHGVLCDQQRAWHE